jgi:hypothetical protein
MEPSAELTDSKALLGDWAALRARIAADGYIFMRQLLDPDVVQGIGRSALGHLPAEDCRTLSRHGRRHRSGRFGCVKLPPYCADHGIQGSPSTPDGSAAFRHHGGRSYRA